MKKYTLALLVLVGVTGSLFGSENPTCIYIKTFSDSKKLCVAIDPNLKNPHAIISELDIVAGFLLPIVDAYNVRYTNVNPIQFNIWFQSENVASWNGKNGEYTLDNKELQIILSDRQKRDWLFFQLITD